MAPKHSWLIGHLFARAGCVGYYVALLYTIAQLDLHTIYMIVEDIYIPSMPNHNVRMQPLPIKAIL